MTDANGRMAAQSAAGRFLGSLKDALQAAGRPEAPSPAEMVEATARTQRPAHSPAITAETPPPRMMAPAEPPAAAPLAPTPASTEPAHTAPQAAPEPDAAAAAAAPPPLPSAAEAAREARGRAPRRAEGDHHREFDEPVTRIVRPAAKGTAGEPADAAPRTQVLRGRQAVARGEFKQDPVVGWLVVVGGNGLGSFRPIFEGNNSIGRATTNRIAIDFGDDAISAGEQAYIRYDSNDRSFLLVPNLAKTNVVSLNDKRPTQAVALNAMDVITMGRTQLVFVPFCGPDFDWSELGELRG